MVKLVSNYIDSNESKGLSNELSRFVLTNPPKISLTASRIVAGISWKACTSSNFVIGSGTVLLSWVIVCSRLTVCSLFWAFKRVLINKLSNCAFKTISWFLFIAVLIRDINAWAYAELNKISGVFSGLIVLINGRTSLSGNDTLGTIYNKYKSNDGFIYIAYASEEIWGAYQ